jgi:hypothetical protein
MGEIDKEAEIQRKLKEYEIKLRTDTIGTTSHTIIYDIYKGFKS